MTKIVRAGVCALSALFFGVASASPVTSEEAAEAVGTWITLESQLGCRLGATVSGARTCTPTNGVTFHVVKTAGGGFVVTSSDTQIEPILAFSESDDFVESADNPLWVMLCRDLSARVNLHRQQQFASAASASSAVAQSAAESKWAQLLPSKSVGGNGRTMLTATGKSTLSDVRVEPLLQSKWSQEQDSYYSNMGDPCYNYYTPNNYPCGCVATAGAQVMRYHRFPTSYVTPGTYDCKLETGKDWISATSYYPIYEDRSLTMQGGYYDWNSMPLVPADGTTLAQRKAIGKLTSDVGITCLMAYGDGGSSSAGYMLSRSLPERFGYASALAYCGTGIAVATVRKVLISNLDAKLPVIMGLDGSSGGHAVVCDGYGYSLSTFYAHFNMGWAGKDDAWYAPPNIGEDFYSVDSIVYNIYPSGVADGVICSGRVLSSSGSPVSGASVSASGATSATATTDANGIYSLILSPGYYTISSGSASKSVTLVANVGSNVTDDGMFWSSPTPAVNNVYGLDLTVSDSPSIVTHTVTFNLGAHGTRTGGGELTQTVTDGEAAVAPTLTVADGWKFTGWDKAFAAVTADLTVTAQYEELPVAVSAGKWTTDVDAVKSAKDCNMVVVLCANYGGCWWSKRAQTVFESTAFLSWAAENGVYLVTADSSRLPSGCTDATAANSWFWTLYYSVTHPDGYVYYPSIAVARPTNFNKAVGYDVVRDDGDCTVGGLVYEGTAASLIAGLKTYLAETVTVTFNANGGSVSESSRKVAKGSAVGNLPTPTRSGYAFGGWYTAASGGTKVTSSTVVNSAVTWYAHWTKNVVTHTVTFNLGAHGTRTGGGALTQTVADGAAAVAPTLAVDDGWEFTGWNRTFSNVTSDITVTAQYAAVEPEEPEETVTLTIANGFTYDPETGEPVAKTSRSPEEVVELVFDESKIEDKNGYLVGAFQKWIVEPADVDLGADFDPYSMETFVVMPGVDVRVSAQYVAKVGAYVGYELNNDGDSEEWDGAFYWSPDGGKTLIENGVSYPLAAGKVTVSFYALDCDGYESQLWIVPNDVTVTVPSLLSSDEEIGELWLTEWFVLNEYAESVVFDANGGSCLVSSRWYRDGGLYYSLPTAAGKSGYAFAGWWTKKTGGERVYVNDDVDFALFGDAAPQLYAHWAKAYTLTLKGTDVTAEYEGETYENSVSVLQDGLVTLRAPDSYYDKQDNAYLFQCWTANPAKYDLGGEYSSSSCETMIVMPAAKLTMTATYVKEADAAWVTLYADGDSGDAQIEADTSKFYWSVDGKAWFQNGTTALVKKGTYTVQWKSLSSAWTAPTTKSKIKVNAGDEYSNEEDPAVFTFAMTLSVTRVVYANGERYESEEGGTVTMNPTSGVIPTGKTVKLTAKTAKGYAFVGWQLENDWNEYGLYPLAQSSTFTVGALEYFYNYIDEDDSKIHLNAIFRPISDYTAEGMARVFESVISGCSIVTPEYDDDDYNASVEIRVGLQCSAYVSLGYAVEAGPLTFKVSGTLPKGLKFATSDGSIYGTPTVAGTYPLVVTATDPAGHSAKLDVSLVVRSVFEPIVGNWRGLLTDDSGTYAGIVEMSVTDKGKASAKIITAKGTTSVTPTVTWYADAEDTEADGTFEISFSKCSGNDKSGSSSYFQVDPSTSEVVYESLTWKNYEETSSVYLAGSIVHADSSWFNNVDFASSFLGKYYTVELAATDGDELDGYRTPSELMASGYLTITTDKKGSVKVAGKLPDGEKVSASTVLLPSEYGDSASALVFVVPSGYKKKGSVALKLDFTEDYSGDASSRVSSSVGSWVTPPLLDAISGCDCEGDVFLPGYLQLSANGAVYSKLADLTGYYMSLAVSLSGEMPTLEYTYTDYEKEKYYEYAESVFESYCISSDNGMLTGGKNGKITVGKSPAPWKDSEGYYNYEVTKEDKYGETKPITNPSGLTISFKPATGIFSGKFNLFFDYAIPQYDKYGDEKDPKLNHKSVSCSYEGVVVGGDSNAYGIGSAVYSGKYTYEYETYNSKTDTTKSATKTYSMKYALPVSWSMEAGE